MPGLLADCFADRLHTHPGQHTVHLSVAAAPPKDLGQNGGRSYHPVPFVVGHLQPHIHRTVGGRLRHSLVVEHHHAGSTGARPPSPAHGYGDSEGSATTSSSLPGQSACSSSAT